MSETMYETMYGMARQCTVWRDNVRYGETMYGMARQCTVWRNAKNSKKLGRKFLKKLLAITDEILKIIFRQFFKLNIFAKNREQFLN